MKNEFPIWGIKPNDTIESLLCTKCVTFSEALKVKELLEKKYNCTECRIQILDFGTPIANDFKKSINI